MSDSETVRKKKNWNEVMNNRPSSTKVGFFMFLGFIGAATYFVSRADGFWDGVLGILKAMVWPAFLIFELFQNLMG